MGVCAHPAPGGLGRVSSANESVGALSECSGCSGANAHGVGLCSVGSFLKGCSGVGQRHGTSRDHRTRLILSTERVGNVVAAGTGPGAWRATPTSCWRMAGDRKSTRLNSSHLVISYAVFCLKKKKI